MKDARNRYLWDEVTQFKFAPRADSLAIHPERTRTSRETSVNDGPSLTRAKSSSLARSRIASISQRERRTRPAASRFSRFARPAPGSFHRRIEDRHASQRSRWVEDSQLQAIEHARHTSKRGGIISRPFEAMLVCWRELPRARRHSPLGNTCAFEFPQTLGEIFHEILRVLAARRKTNQ